MHSNEAESSCERTGTNGARNDSLNNENFAKDREHLLPARRTVFIKTEINLSHRSCVFIAMDGRDCVLFEMNRRLILIVRFKSDGLIWSKIHLMRMIWTVITLDRTVAINSLKASLSTCVIFDCVDHASTRSTRSINTRTIRRLISRHVTWN